MTEPFNSYREFLIKRRAALEETKTVQKYLETVRALEEVDGPSRPDAPTGQQLEYIKVLADRHKLDPPVTKGWTKHDATNWLDTHETVADRRQRIERRGDDPF